MFKKATQCRLLKPLVFLETRAKLLDRHRRGILETLQALPSTAAPSVQARGENATTRFNATNSESTETLNAKKKPSFALNANTSNTEAPTFNALKAHNGTNSQQHVQSLSPYQLNSFPHPTSIPVIDALFDPSPTPMGSIESEMEKVEKAPMADELRREEAKTRRVSTEGRIHLDFEEEEPWERSRLGGKQGAFNAEKDFKRCGVFHENRERMTLFVKLRGNLADYPGKAATEGHIDNIKKGKSDLKQQDFGELPCKGVNLQEKSIHIKDKKIDHDKRYGIKRSRSPKRVSITPPSIIDPIEPLLEKFQPEKKVSNIKEHTVDFENMIAKEPINHYLPPIKTSKIQSIARHFAKDHASPIEPIGNRLIKEHANNPA